MAKFTAVTVSVTAFFKRPLAFVYQIVMGSILAQHEIFWSIVRLVSIDMMWHNLLGKEYPQHLLTDQHVLKHVSQLCCPWMYWNPDLSVSPGHRRATLPPRRHLARAALEANARRSGVPLPALPPLAPIAAKYDLIELLSCVFIHGGYYAQRL
jgi:hypothetical protein